MSSQVERILLMILIISLAVPLVSLNNVQAEAKDQGANSNDPLSENKGIDPSDEDADASKEMRSAGSEGIAASSVSSSVSVASSSSASALGDFNGDLYEDLAIGVPGEYLGTGNSITLAGAVNVLYGSSSGIQATGTGGPDDQFWNQNSGSVND